MIMSKKHITTKGGIIFSAIIIGLEIMDKYNIELTPRGVETKEIPLL